MSNNLITQLSQLKLEKSCIKRNIDRNYYNAELRTKLFTDLKEVEKEIERVKFKIRLERIKKNDIKY